jgi:ABC-2 type transport system ATP-binding protein
VPAPADAAVVVDGLVVRYGPLTAVDGLSLAARAGQVTALLGPNGAGKTSTVEVLEGFRPAAAGTVRVLGLDPARQHGELVHRIGVMLQQGGVYPGIRADEAVALFCAYHGNRRVPADLLAEVDLVERRRATWRHLSGGEQQRLSLALAMAGEPDVLFLDEPTASVDPAGRRRLRALIRAVADRGCCVLLTTHDLEEAERLADHVVILNAGMLVAAGSPQELTRGAAVGDLRFGAPAALDRAGLSAALGGVAVDEPTPGEYIVRAAPEPARVAALTAWLAAHDLPLADLRAGRQRLEDVYLALTSERSMAADAPGRAERRRRRRGRGRASREGPS